MLSPRFKKDLHMGPKQSEMHFEKQEKEKNDSYPDANRIEIMIVTRVWPSGDSQGQCSKKSEGYRQENVPEI